MPRHSRTLVIASFFAAACGGGGLDSPTIPTPTPGTSALLTLVSGDQQRGLTGRALADSLVVRASGADVPISWSASGGSLSAQSMTSDANGLARVQWIPGSGDATVTAATSGSTNVVFRSNGRTSGACTLAPLGQRMTLGATDFTLSLRSTVAHRVVVLFMDFSDAPATETPASLVGLVVDPGIALLRELSYNRTQITTTVVPRWYRMSQQSATYNWRTYEGHKAYLTEAMRLADADVDFSQYTAVYIFASANAQQVVSPTFNGGQSAGVTFDGKVIGNAVTFGQDSRRYGAAIFAHETGHMFGLVDLYAYDPAAGSPYAGNQFRDVGAWSLMSNVFVPGHTLAWEKRKLGFLDDNQVDCLDAGPGGEEAIVQPVEVAGGLKMVAVPLDASRALVVEVRSSQGLDANLCAQGVLVYEVNAAAPSGVGPAKIRGSRTTTSGTVFNRCGPWADAIYGVGAGSVSSFTDAASGVSVQVLAVESGGAYRVRVKR